MAAGVARTTTRSTSIVFAVLLLVVCFLKEVLAAKNYTLKPRVVLPEDYVKAWSRTYLHADAPVSRYLLELLQPICQHEDVYQLKFLRHGQDRQSNDILSSVLGGLQGTLCARQITLQDDALQQFITSKKYFIIFTNNSPEGFQAFYRFLTWKINRFGSARFVIVVLLLYPNINAFQMFRFENWNRPFNIVLLFYDFRGTFDCVSLEPFIPAVLIHGPERASFGTLEELFRRQYRNLHGYEFTIYFTRGDDVSRNLPTNRYIYFIDSLARRINARYRIHTENIRNWRQNNPMDFGIVYDTFQAHPIKRIPLKQFTYHCVLAPKSDRVPFIRLLIDPFHWTVWFTLLLVSTLTSVLLRRFGYQEHRRPSLLTAHFDIFQTFINGPARSVLDTGAGNCLLTAYVYASLILITIYQSLLTARLSQTLFLPDFRTVDEVNRSGLPIHVHQYIKQISNVTFLHEVNNSAPFDLRTNRYAQVIPCDVAERWSRRRWDIVHLVQERLAPFQDTFVLFYYSPFDETLDFYWTAFVEGDLFRYWSARHWLYQERDVHWPGPQKVEEEIRVFKVHDLLICWTILAFEVRPPSEKGSPVVVEFSIFVVDINSINVEDMDFRVDMFVHQKWVESRLDLHDDIFEDGDDHVILPPEFFDNLWQPDPYFLNSKISGQTFINEGMNRVLCGKLSCMKSMRPQEIATLTHKFSSVTLYKNSTVRYACMMHAIIACQMEFQLYPMDIQICPIYIESFSYHNQKIRLKWADNGVTINPELKLLQYNLGRPLQLEETDGYMPEKYGNFSRLAVYFRFERQIGHHLIQTFAPSSLVVMLSWFSFWLGLDAIPGRVTLLVTCMLTLVTMFTGMRADIPPVAYVKALDLWMAGCMLFVFSALGEFVVVKVLDVQYQYQVNKVPKVLPMRISAMEKGQSIGTVANWEGGTVSVRPRKPTQTPTTPGQVSLQGNGGPQPALPPAKQPTRRQSILSVAWTDTDTGLEKIMWREIDKMSRIVFPGLFLVFVVLYWPILIFKTS